MPLCPRALGLAPSLTLAPGSEVRRAALFNLPRTPAFLPHILMRTRDVDPILRRTVYHGPLSAAALNADMLSVAQREQVVRNGLGDREPSVRKAAAAMLAGWVDQVEGDLVEVNTLLGHIGKVRCIDLGTVPQPVRRWFGRSGRRLTLVGIHHPPGNPRQCCISRYVLYPIAGGAGVGLTANVEAYWTSLTPEKALLARVFVDHCIATKDDSRLEDALPVVTALAFRIQDEYNSLVTSTTEENDDIPERSFIVGELLRLAINLDYADEIGRRKMFTLARQSPLS